MMSIGPLALVVLSLIGFWIFIVVLHPISLWGVPEDAPVMSLAEAVNIDFWLTTSGPRVLSQAQFYQPGMYFQIISWLAYRLSAPSLFMPAMELFKANAIQPLAYWFYIQSAALALVLAAIIFLWKQVKAFDFLSLLTVLTIYFSCVSATRYGIFMFWNESFTLLFAILFFSYAVQILNNSSSLSSRSIFICGLFAGLLYLHKLNYVVWGLAFLPALIVRAWLIERRFRRVIAQIGIYFLAIFVSVECFGRIFLGAQGFSKMLSAHKEIFMGSEIYGGGPRTFVSLRMIVQDFKNFYYSDPIAFVLFFSFLVLPPLYILIKRKDRDWLNKHLPHLTLLLAALSAMGLALLKHFQTHYTVSIAALFPLFIIWFWQSDVRAKKIIPFLLPLIIFGIYRNTNTQIENNRACLATEIATLADEAEILKMPMGANEKRLWMYRTIVPSFQRLFILDFSGLKNLQSQLDEMQGAQWLISPWQSSLWTPNGVKEIAQVNWRYIVITTEALTANLISLNQHGWMNDKKIKKTVLRKLTVFENSTNF